MIWAFGDITDGVVQEHGHDDAGDITVYVYGSGCDGVKPTTTLSDSGTSGGDDDDDDSGDDSGSSSGGTDCLDCSSDANLRSVSLVSLFITGLIASVFTFA